MASIQKDNTKKVMYTALFGPRGDLGEPSGDYADWDFICFTNRDDLKSKVWQIIKVDEKYQDATRNARMYKVLPHKFLEEYSISIWMDGNMIPLKNPDQLVENFLSKCNLAVFNHENNVDSMDCIYQEAENLLRLDSIGRRKDDPEIIKKQVQKYRNEGYPERNGLAVTQVLIRRHNEPDVIETMETWWNEIKNNSKRDQLSFNYAVWKNKFPFTYLPGDSRNNEWFKYFPHQKWSLKRKIKSRISKLLR